MKIYGAYLEITYLAMAICKPDPLLSHKQFRVVCRYSLCDRVNHMSGMNIQESFMLDELYIRKCVQIGGNSDTCQTKRLAKRESVFVCVCVQWEWVAVECVCVFALSVLFNYSLNRTGKHQQHCGNAGLVLSSSSRILLD